MILRVAKMIGSGRSVSSVSWVKNYNQMNPCELVEISPLNRVSRPT